jgi:methionine-rich copper-binding protein CopC
VDAFHEAFIVPDETIDAQTAIPGTQEITMNTKQTVIAAITALVTITGAVVLAHSNVKASTPKDHAHVKVMPKTVSLTFDEALETKLSSFKVIYAPMESMMKNGKPISGSAMDDVAEKIANAAMSAKTDGKNRVDAGYAPGTKAQTKTVVLALKPGMNQPGVYVVAFRTTSVDTHVEKGFIHFHYDGTMMK